MASAVQEASGFQELLERGEDGPYVFAQMFSTDGWGARRRSKNTFKLLKKIDLPLRKMLREGERVFFVTRGVAQPSILECYFLGAALEERWEKFAEPVGLARYRVTREAWGRHGRTRRRSGP